AAAWVSAEHAVLRATAVEGARHPVVLGDHVFVGPHATLLGCVVERCAYLATGITILQAAHIGAGACVAVGALVHARTRIESEFFVGPQTIAVGDPVRVFTPDQTDEVSAAIRDLNFAGAAFGVTHEWTDRIARYERMAEVRVEEFAAHLDDRQVT